jgi:hypothetical protein
MNVYTDLLGLGLKPASLTAKEFTLNVQGKVNTIQKKNDALYDIKVSSSSTGLGLALAVLPSEGNCQH